jgi:hypothetical protein
MPRVVWATFLVLSGAVATAATSSSVLALQSVGWEKYAVPKTGASVEMPTKIFSEDAGKPERGYGRRFRTKDGRANLTVQSFPNSETESPRSFLTKHFRLPRSAAACRRVGPNFFVISGLHVRNIWYDRCNFVGSYIDCVALNYPFSEKRDWDYIVTRISNTLTKG